ncbi:hypothetical protein [Manganibacter manganicus]|nr:hypothetical protein [Pseudaminobacter manganicus]
MAGWDKDGNGERDVLERIVALLFALAQLADRAAGAPFLRRRHVLGILSRGEAEAWAFLFGSAPVPPVPADAPEQAGDAARLAARLRVLALLLCAMLTRRAARPGTAGQRASQPPHEMSGPTPHRPDVPAPPAPDTS